MKLNFYPLLAGWIVGLSACAVRAVDVTFVNLNGGSFNEAANWEPQMIPGPNDKALITRDGTYTVTLNGNVTVESFVLGGGTGRQILAFAASGPNLTVSGAGTVASAGAVEQPAGALSGAGDVALNGSWLFSGGNFSGTGALNIGQGGRAGD